MDLRKGFAVTFYVGAGTTHGLTPAEVQAGIQEMLADRFGGATMIQGFGAWRSPAGEMITEPSVMGKVVVMDDESAEQSRLLQELSERMAEQFEQQAVMVEIQPVSVAFVAAPVKEPISVTLV